MTGKLIGIAIMLSALIAGGAMYYLQIYAFYEEVTPASAGTVMLTTIAGGAPEPIIADDFEGIDASSSPIRYRACFTTSMSHAMLSETYVAYDTAEPLTAPGWFECYDAAAIAEGLASGTALPFLAEKNIAYGVDRVVAIFGDGRAYVWHQLNDCGAKAYDGTPTGEECPPRTFEDQ